MVGLAGQREVEKNGNNVGLLIPSEGQAKNSAPSKGRLDGLVERRQPRGGSREGRERTIEGGLSKSNRGVSPLFSGTRCRGKERRNLDPPNNPGGSDFKCLCLGVQKMLTEKKEDPGQGKEKKTPLEGSRKAWFGRKLTKTS